MVGGKKFVPYYLSFVLEELTLFTIRDYLKEYFRTET